MSTLSKTQLINGNDVTIYPKNEIPVNETVETYIDTFMQKVNEKAQSLKMTNSNFIKAAGNGNNTTTAHDLLKLVVGSIRYNEFMNIWSTKEKTIYTQNKTPKTINLTTSVTSTAFENYYTLLGGKTGSYGSSRALVIIGLCEGKVLAGAIMGAETDSGRFVAMKELFDIAKKALNNEDVSGDTVASATSAVVCEIPQIPSLYDSNEFPVLFEQEPNTILNPASVSKVITCITALDYIDDLDETVEMISSDMVGGSGNVFSVGDIVSIRDLLYAIMLPSSNQSAEAIARTIGKKIISRELNR